MKKSKNRARPPAAPAQARSPQRQRLFTIILLALPVLFFVVLETGLRLGHYGGDLNLVLLRQDGEARWYQINRDVAKRYFTDEDITVPEARGESFRYQKLPNTFRIFCLGESSTAGWPYQFNATFPSLLHDRLALLFPDRDIEVINVGISAISSYSVLDFVHELVQYEPDLFLMYLGHNEFYGALGAASTQHISSNRTVVRLFMQLEKLRLYLLLRNGVHSLKRMVAPAPSTGGSRTLMEMMIGHNTIPLQSPLYRQGVENFSANLSDILQTIHSRRVPVLVGTLVSNLADLEPFESQFRDGFREKDEWSALVQQGQDRFSAGQYQSALASFQQAAQLDSMPAMLSFRIGQCYRALHRYEAARQAFIRARDLDVVRFRAGSDFNDVIRTVCAQQQVPVVEVERAFQERSAEGLIGYELLLEHVHPNFFGYFVMADAFCRAMAAHDIITASSQWPWQRDLPEEELQRLAYVTDLDLAIAAERIKTLTSRYPFKTPRTIVLSADRAYEKVLLETVQALQRRELGWNQAHYRMADYLQKQGRWPEAEREYRAVLKIMPAHFYPYLYLADALQAQGKAEQAEQALLKAAVLTPQLPYAHAKLGLYHMSVSQPEKAIPFLQQAVRGFVNVNDVSTADQARVRYLLAVALAQTFKLSDAKAEAAAAARLAPQDLRIRELMHQIESALASK